MQWRIPLMVQIFPAVILGIGMFFLPYSPRWLAQQGEGRYSLPAFGRGGDL
jgi:hypothetical protein